MVCREYGSKGVQKFGLYRDYIGVRKGIREYVVLGLDSVIPY